MQVIIPLAGKGTRLRPHTHLVPKPLLKVAGRPVMDWVMDTLSGLDVTELIFITGHLKEQVEEYARARYPIPSRFIEQKVQDGTAGAVNLARQFVREPILIVFVDTVFEADLTLINRTNADGIIWAKEVEDYQRFGVVVTDKDGYMTKIVEKPSTPISKLANIGLYYIKDTAALWRGIDHTLASPTNKGEYYLTDAFQHMIENGKKTVPVKGAMLIGNGPEVLTRVSMVGNDLKLDAGLGTCGKDGQSVPVGVGQPTIRIDSLTVGGTQA